MNRMQRDTERQMRAYEEGKAKMERFKENTQNELDRMTPDDVQISYWRNGRYKTGETISANDPLASKKLQAKLEYQQESQQRMKDANAYYRKNGSMKGFEGFSESTNAKIDAAMSSSGSSKPFASYSLTNNNAQIKATQQRLAQQQKLDAARSSSSSSGGSAGGFSFKGGSVVQNTGINRLQIKFDSIPDASMRAKLKSEGWRWSPREQAWQRQLTANAESSAKRILGSSMEKALDEEPVAKTFNESMVEKFNPYHDRMGRFSSASGAASMTIRTRSGLWQNAANRSIERAKQHHAATMPTAAQAKTLKSIESRTRNLKKEQFRVVDREGNVVMERKGDAHSVAYSIGDARDNFPGNITIHNHPSGGTFSTADLSDIGYGATEIRAAAPEGTYVLRNTRYGQKYDGATTKTWYDMRNDLESASTEFKSGIALKKQVRSQFSKENAEIDELARKGVEVMRSKGSDSPEFKAIHSEYTQKSDALRGQIETATRTAYTDQYHNWYKSHAMEYGLEYEFIPAKSRTQKAMMEDAAMEDVTKARKGDVVLDQKMEDDIQEITDKIMQDILSSTGAAKVFGNRNKKTA